MSTLEPTADKPSNNDLPLGTTPPYARMHKWLKRALFVCLFGLVIEGSFTMPARSVVATRRVRALHLGEGPGESNHIQTGARGN